MAGEWRMLSSLNFRLLKTESGCTLSVFELGFQEPAGQLVVHLGAYCQHQRVQREQGPEAPASRLLCLAQMGHPV